MAKTRLPVRAGGHHLHVGLGQRLPRRKSRPIEFAAKRGGSSTLVMSRVADCRLCTRDGHPVSGP